MLKLKSSEVTIWFTSDLHLNHSKIIEYCNRPFSNVEEMNETIIGNWNKVVSPEDVVFCLGDIALGGSGAWNTLIPQLNGKIHLVLGNHDIRNWRESYKKLFESVTEQLTVEIDKKTFILTHFPLLCYHGTWGSEQNCWNLFGHIHTLKEGNIGKDFERLKNLFPTQYDVGVDLNDYTPMHIEQVRNKIKYQIENNTNLLCWIK